MKAGYDLRKKGNILLIAGFVTLAPNSAFAYLDGGTVSMAIQMIAGGIGLGLLFIRQWWSAFLRFFKKEKRPEQTEDFKDR